MNLEQLIEEAQQLLRPCVHLKQQPNGNSPTAVWKGSPLVEHPTFDTSSYSHWLSLDCRYLPEGFEDLSGCVSVYILEYNEEGVVAFEPSMKLESSSDSSIELFAYPGVSWPPIDAIAQFGSPQIKEALEKYDSQTDKVVWAYQQHIQPLNPMYDETEEVFAMLGGWNEPWPEDDWLDFVDKRLIALTYRDAEPWVEVWVDNERSFQVVQRIT